MRRQADLVLRGGAAVRELVLRGLRPPLTVRERLQRPAQLEAVAR
jgi:hypothetical protein